jgi:hypothetical protein
MKDGRVDLMESFRPHYGPGINCASNRNEYQKMFLWSNARSARKKDNLTAICEPTVHIIWDPRHLTSLEASRPCYKDGFTFTAQPDIGRLAS